MGDLTKNFSRREFACKCCGETGPLSMELVEGLQELRDKVGVPLHVVSGYRCDKHNDAIGGAKRSQHKEAKAADVATRTHTPSQLYAFAEEIDVFNNGGMGLYRGFTHLDVREHKARW